MKNAFHSLRLRSAGWLGQVKVAFGGAKMQVTGYRLQATGQVTGQVTGHRPQVRLQATGQVTGHTQKQ